MEIAFRTKRLRHVCESEEKASQVLGSRVTEKLKHRLADLRAAVSIEDIVVGNPQKLPGSQGLDMSIDLCDGYRVMLRANHINNPLLSDGDIDWSAVYRVQILEIEESDA